jgi:chemotaxis protein CheC
MNEERLLAPLTEVARDGAARAGRGLSGLLGQEIAIHVPAIRFGSRADACDAVGGTESVVLGSYLQIDGDITGHVMLLFPVERALWCADIMCGEEPGTTTEVDEMTRSAIAELGNIVGSAFINAFGDRINIVLHPSPPVVVEDIAGALVQSVYAEVLASGGELVMIDTEFEDRSGRTAGLMMIAPDPASLERIEETVKAA